MDKRKVSIYHRDTENTEKNRANEPQRVADPRRKGRKEKQKKENGVTTNDTNRIDAFPVLLIDTSCRCEFIRRKREQ